MHLRHVILASLTLPLFACASGMVGDTPYLSTVEDASSSADPLSASDGGSSAPDGTLADAEAAADMTPDAEPPGCVPSMESCDGVDEDCDGHIDEGAAGCPCEAIVRDTQTYMVCPTRRSWAGARLFCESHGYTLAIVESAAEDAFLYEAIAARGFADTWIGHNDLLEEGRWVWLDGLPIVYSHWDEGEPNDGGGEDCGLIMTRHGREAEWDDRPCESERPYICEAGPEV